MSQHVLADNWSLQDVSIALSEGLSTDQANTLVVAGGEHHVLPIPAAVTAIESLFDLLTDIVLRDQILIDKGFMSAWDSNDTYTDLLKGQIVKPYEFLDYAERFTDIRTVILDRLLLSDSLREAQRKNEESYAATGRSYDPWLGQVVWGGAGMISRASAFNISYTPHPVRRRFFEFAGLAWPASSAAEQVTSFIEEQRATVRNSIRGKDRLHRLQISLDPIPIMVIAESNSIRDLIPTALQLRSDFTKFRDWLGAYETELYKDDFQAVKTQQRLLKSVEMYVGSKTGYSWADTATLKAGISAVDISVQFRPLNNLFNRFGVRPTINRLVFQPNGLAQMKKLLRLFGHETSGTGVKVMDHFTRQMS